MLGALGFSASPAPNGLGLRGHQANKEAEIVPCQRTVVFVGLSFKLSMLVWGLHTSNPICLLGR